MTATPSIMPFGFTKTFDVTSSGEFKIMPTDESYERMTPYLKRCKDFEIDDKTFFFDNKGFDQYMFVVTLENGKTFTWLLNNNEDDDDDYWEMERYHNGKTFTWLVNNNEYDDYWEMKRYHNDKIAEITRDIDVGLDESEYDDTYHWISVTPPSDYRGKITFSVCRTLLVPESHFIKAVDAVKELYTSTTTSEPTNSSLEAIPDMITKISESVKKPSGFSSWFY